MLRRRPESTAPGDLLVKIQDAQHAHAEAVNAANQRLLDTHESVFTTAKDRQRAIKEQISLLQAEHDGHQKVVEAAGRTPLAGQ